VGCAPGPPPPTISVQPADKTMGCGGSVTFQVVADGAPPLSYLWLANGQRLGIPPTKDTLEVTNVYFESGTKFKVVVTNAFGVVVSDSAILTVTNSPVPEFT